MKTQDIINELYKTYWYDEESIIYKACEKLAYLQNKSYETKN